MQFMEQFAVLVLVIYKCLGQSQVTADQLNG